MFSPTQGEFLAAPLQDPTQATVITDNALGHWQDQSGAFWFYNLDNYYYYQPASGELKILPGLREKLPMKLAGRFLGLLPDEPDKMLLTAADQLWLYQRSDGSLTKIFQSSQLSTRLEPLCR